MQHESRAAQPMYIVLRSGFCAGSSPARRLPHLFPARATGTCSHRHFAALFVVIDPYHSCGIVLDGNGSLSVVSLRWPSWLYPVSGRHPYPSSGISSVSSKALL